MPLPKSWTFSCQGHPHQPWMSVVEGRLFHMSSMDENIILAAEENDIVPGNQDVGGKKYLRSSVSSGQPIVKTARVP